MDANFAHGVDRISSITNFFSVFLAPKRKRTCLSVKQNTVQYLMKKNERNYELRQRELDIKERELKLKEKQHELDLYERKKRLEIEEKRTEMEEQRMKVIMETFSSQQQLFQIICSNFSKAV